MNSLVPGGLFTVKYELISRPVSDHLLYHLSLILFHKTTIT